MSNAAQSWAWQQEGLLSSDKLILVALADNAWEDGSNAWPSVALLCRKTSLCRRTVQTALRRLTAAGMISEQAAAEPDQNKPTTYRLAMTPRAESAPPRATAAPALAQSVRKPRASDAPPPAHLTTDPRAADAPELSTNQLQLQPTSKEDVADEPRRVDVEWLCTHFADRIEGNGAKRPTVTKQWRTSARLLLDADKRDEQQAHRLIDWTHDHHFWSGNVLSLPTFRKQYDRLLLQARNGQQARPSSGHQPYRNPSDQSVYDEPLEAS